MATRSTGALDQLDAHRRWLEARLPTLFTGTLREDRDAIEALEVGLGRLRTDRQLVAADRSDELVLARLDIPGSVFETLRRLDDRDISRAEISHSHGSVPGTERALELHHYVFDRKADALVRQASAADLPEAVRRDVLAALAAQGRGGGMVPEEQEEALRILWVNDRRYVEAAPAAEVARMLRLLHEGRAHDGLFLGVEPCAEPGAEPNEVIVLFAVESPPARDFLIQLVDVFHGLDIGLRRSLALTIGTGAHPFFLGMFHAAHRQGARLDPGTELFGRLRRLLYNTQILATASPAYRDFVLPRVMSGEEASLVNAFIGFCHTNSAHAQPHRYTFEDVVRAFHSHPDMALRLVRLFEARFDPDVPDREARWQAELESVAREVETYATGHRQLDDFRRSVFRIALVFVKRTLKTNFFVVEKRALAFRLDPAYLDDLGPAFTGDLPAQRPFRVTFFFGRSGLGYHIGFADIARGGWRTIITRTRDDFATVANTIFRENYVLAHTQHLKNKDIYEGGSKLVCVLHAPGVQGREQLDQRLHRLQWEFANAFLDVFVTEGGRPRDPRVVDHYGEEEPIELGPDENMHDEMIEAIAALSVRRGYVLGSGIMSSKKVGINHKQYGVTSLGVVTFAEIAMREQGIDLRRDPFTLKLTGGPNGDVAGNALRLLLERCPRVRIGLIVDGAVRDVPAMVEIHEVRQAVDLVPRDRHRRFAWIGLQVRPKRERVVIPTWAERSAQTKDKRRPSSIFGSPKPATSG